MSLYVCVLTFIGLFAETICVVLSFLPGLKKHTSTIKTSTNIGTLYNNDTKCSIYGTVDTAHMTLNIRMSGVCGFCEWGDSLSGERDWGCLALNAVCIHVGFG